ncbi:MAG TPA: DUF58 domain-containing protein [Dissulfurispiraceae bacterium]|nr:DUF58 domain-containing protein [Dissulfurispiraceae bacterium]
MVLSGFFGRHNLTSVDVVFSLPDEVYAGTGFPLAVTLRNRRRFFPVFLMKVHIDGRELVFPFVDAGREETLHIHWEFELRGRYRIAGIRICSVFPFSFFTRCRFLPAAHDGVVFAQPKRCSFFQEELFVHRRMQGERSLDSAGFDAEAISVRDYVSGDPLKYVHWKATARTGTLKTKELAALVHEPVVVEFDRVQIESLEEKISCITGFILQMHRRGAPVGLHLGDKLLKPSLLQPHKRAMLRELAVYGRYDSE